MDFEAICHSRVRNYQETFFADFKEGRHDQGTWVCGQSPQGFLQSGVAARGGELAAADGIEVEVFEIDGIPLYNQDDESAMPAVVRDFKSRIEQADALLMVTPEFNYSVSGVLKNAIDWASRPYGANSFEEKPVAIMGATIGTLGTARAQYHLRQMLVYVNAYPLNRPEVMVSSAADKFSNGELVDAHTRQKVREQLVALAAWAKQLHPD